MSLNKIERTLAKAAIVGVIGGVVSAVALGGMRPVHMFGASVPMSIATAGTLTAASIGAGYIIPALTTGLLKVAPGGTLSKIEAMLLEPAAVALVGVVTTAILAPEAIADAGGVVGDVMLGAGAQVLASYVSNGMGWSATVI